MNRVFDFEVSAEFQQFLLRDETTDDLPSWLSPDESRRLLAVEEEAVGIGTISEMPVQVILEVSGSPPHSNLTNWDHATEFSLNLPSGRLIVSGICDSGDSRHIEVEPGSYRVRVHYGNLGRAMGSCREHYWVVLWRETPRQVLILKQTTMTGQLQ